MKALISLLLTGCILTIIFVNFTCSHASTKDDDSWQLNVQTDTDQSEQPYDIGAQHKLSVVLKNISDKTQRIWQESNSWGYSIISFTVSDNSGNTAILLRKERGWRKNIPTFIRIEPGQTHTWTFTLNQDEWLNVSTLKSGHIYRLQAKLNITSNDETREYKIWTGTLLSQSVNVVYRNQTRP